MHQFGSLKSHQQKEGNWDSIFKDSTIYSRCVKCCIFSLLFPVSLVWSSWLCGLETPGQLCFVSWGCGGRSSGIAVKLTVNRFCMNADKALKLGTRTAEERRWGEKILSIWADGMEIFLVLSSTSIDVDITGRLTSCVWIR